MTVGVGEVVPVGPGIGLIERRRAIGRRRARAGNGGGVGLRHRRGRDRLVVDLRDLLRPRSLGVDSGQVVEVVGGARGALHVLDVAGVGRVLHGADSGDDVVGVAAVRSAAPERSPAFPHALEGARRLPARRDRRRGRRLGVRAASASTAAGDQVPHPQRGLHQRAKARLHRRDHGALKPRHRRHVRTRTVLALVERAGELEQQPVGGARPRTLLHAHQPVHPHIQRRGAAKPHPRRHVVAHRRGDEGAARELVAHHPGHDDVVLEVRVHGERPPDVRLHLVGDDHETMTRMLVEHPVDLDCVAPGDDVAVVVGVADLRAVERAGAQGSAPGVLEHRSERLGPQLERVCPFDAFARAEGPVARSGLALGRIEHAEQRRPGRAVDVELAEVPGAHAEAELLLAGVADGALVFIIVGNRVPEAIGEGGGGVRMEIVAWIEADVDEAPVACAAIRAVE